MQTMPSTAAAVSFLGPHCSSLATLRRRSSRSADPWCLNMFSGTSVGSNNVCKNTKYHRYSLCSKCGSKHIGA